MRTTFINHRHVIFASIAMMLCAGCSNPEIVQMSPGTYELARADHGGIFGNKDALKSGVIRDANAFAERNGKVAIPVSAKEHPVGILGDWASYEYVFKVVDKSSPDARISWLLVRTDSVHGGGFTSLGSKDTLYVAKSDVETEGDLSSKHVESSNATTSTDSNKSAVDRLLDLKKLFDAGALTKEEYDAKKKELVEKL
jgi:hypothetical protein